MNLKFEIADSFFLIFLNLNKIYGFEVDIQF